jgi:hypothetical protein
MAPGELARPQDEHRWKPPCWLLFPGACAPGFSARFFQGLLPGKRLSGSARFVLDQEKTPFWVVHNDRFEQFTKQASGFASGSDSRRDVLKEGFEQSAVGQNPPLACAGP